ncbi:MAG: nucleoside-triphosphatase [Deltaproteobacteria bacterium]|nr:nucleoside-triphosphatase [Deltaproteobacteria bacterium]
MSHPRVILLTGPKFSGKSLFVEGLLSSLREKGLRVAGFVQRGVFDAEGRKVGYDLVGLVSGSCRPLARLSDAGHGWLFDDAAFGAALSELGESADLTVIDELGPLELAGKGHARALDLALGSSRAVLVVVREELAGDAERLLAARAAVTVVRFEPGQDSEIAATVSGILAMEEALPNRPIP